MTISGRDNRSLRAVPLPTFYEVFRAQLRTLIAADCDSLDLFSLSRVLDRAGASELARTTCLQAIARGLPEAIEPHALWHLAAQHKRERSYDAAVEAWIKISSLESRYMVQACEELAIHYEHRVRDANKALEFAEAAWLHLQNASGSHAWLERLAHRRERLLRKAQKKCVDGSQPRLSC